MPDDLAPTLDLDAIEAIAAEHVPYVTVGIDPYDNDPDGTDSCMACGFPWPCDTAALVARVRALEGLLRQARRPVRQWVAEYSRDPADEVLLAAIEALPDR